MRWFKKTSPFFISLWFLQTLTSFYNIWCIIYGVNLQRNNYWCTCLAYVVLGVCVMSPGIVNITGPCSFYHWLVKSESAWAPIQLADGHSQLPAPTCGTTFRSTSHLHSHLRSSDSVLTLSSSHVPTLTSWYDLFLSFYHYWLLSSFFSGISRGPCNNWHYLGHVKHVDDDDNDDLS